MWKKNDDQLEATEGRVALHAATNIESPARHSSKECSTIGASIKIEGAIRGSEDLLIQGEVEGEVSLPEHTLTVGSEGKVSANLEAKVIRVEGKVVGDMVGSEQVIVHRSGEVQGNVSAPRVTLEDGAKIKGSVDTDSSVQTAQSSNKSGKQNGKPRSSDPVESPLTVSTKAKKEDEGLFKSTAPASSH